MTTVRSAALNAVQNPRAKSIQSAWTYNNIHDSWLETYVQCIKKKVA